MGMALAVISTRRAIPGHPAMWWLAAAALFVLAAKGAGLAHPSVEGFTHTQVLVRHYLYAAIAFCVLAGGLTGPRPLETRPLRALGRISYGIYLYHLTVLGLLGKWDLASLEDHVHPYLLWSTFAIAGTLVLAAASWFARRAPGAVARGRRAALAGTAPLGLSAFARAAAAVEPRGSLRCSACASATQPMRLRGSSRVTFRASAVAGPVRPSGRLDGRHEGEHRAVAAVLDQPPLLAAPARRRARGGGTAR